ncbi:MAG: hypothetical protein M5U34_26955 [Chloroflexi bacterium]|nr:hypothetical protein [Chloroflexota bacterium]
MKVNANPQKFIILIIIGLLLSTVGCDSSSAQSEIDSSQSLITLSDMPSHWYITSQGALSDDIRQQGGAGIEFNVNDPRVLYVAAHRVYQYKNARQAEREFERQLPIEFNSSSIASKTPWQVPEQLPYLSSVADRFYFACHENSINGGENYLSSYGGNMIIIW